MYKSKLINLLSSFNKNELRSFSEYLASPYYNKNKDILKFYSLLRKYAPEFHPNKIKKEKIFQKLSPNQTYSDKEIKYLMNILLKAAENFITIKMQEKNEFMQNYHLLNSYLERNIEKNYNYIFNKTSKQLTESLIKDTDYFYQQYLINNITKTYYKKKQVRNIDYYNQLTIESLDVYFFVNKLKYACHLFSNQTIISSDYELTLIPEIIKEINRNPEKFNQPAIQIYLLLYDLLSNNKDDLFEQLKTDLILYKNQFESAELKDIYLITINYCIKQLSDKSRTQYFLTELYQLYNQGIQEKILLENGYLSPWTFKNVVKIGLRLEEYDATESFMNKNKDLLESQFQSDAFYYNMADLHYYKGDLDKSLDFLIQVEFSDIYYVIDTKKLMLKIYFESNEEEALYSLIASFRTYLRRNRVLTDNIKTSYLNFIKILEKLKKSNSKKLNAIIKSELESIEKIVDKKWLLKKIVI